MIRNSAVAGQFYPNLCQEIDDEITSFNMLLEKGLKDKEVLNSAVKMIIVPHAGYVYSGFTANVAHRILANAQAKRVVVIGPSHRVYIQGASIALHDTYETPCGLIPMDKDYSQMLQDKFDLLFDKDAHFEHSTETQMPFIHHYLPSAKVTEIVYGDIDYHKLSEVIDFVLDDKDNVVVISTDLSHFYTLKEANKLDSICLKAISELDNKMMQSGCEACGKTGVMAAINVANKKGLKATLLDYKTSADVTKDEMSVVGYLSVIIS